MKEEYLLKEKIAAEGLMHTAWAGKTLYYYETTDSTNVRAKQEAERNAPHGALFVADEQTAGRGRRGRAWQSPAGRNLYFTLLLRPGVAVDKASMLTLVMALAVAEGIGGVLRKEGREASLRPGIKWPNDIVLDGRKVCGILTEMSLEPEQNGIQYVIIGAGINVGKQEFPKELLDKAVSLEELLGAPLSRSRLLADIMQSFERHYEAFLKCQDLTYLREEYEAMLVNYGRAVRVLEPGGGFDGVARGITNTGELLVERPDGSVQRVYAGEVSVRGIYGYV
ncbi:MAG: biotin--[acetyl-CoA-carboxylase] ligase [Roseburia sp.]|nr:biotin--[acetyl-CoA-carboxylase] ligase [Roseburia sp.]